MRFYIAHDIVNVEVIYMDNYSSKAVIEELAKRLRAYRIEYPMTQKELADNSGVSVRSIQNFEHGEDIQLSNLIKIITAFGLLDNLELLIPDVSKKPSMYLEKTKKRVRVRKPKTKNEKEDIFQWGDEI